MTSKTNESPPSIELSTLFSSQEEVETDKSKKLLVDSLYPLRELAEVKDNKIKASKIELSKKTVEILGDLIEKIKKDDDLKKCVLESLDEEKDETSMQLKNLLLESLDKNSEKSGQDVKPDPQKNVEKSGLKQGWVMVEDNGEIEKPEPKTGFAPYMIVTYPLQFAWTTTKFTYRCAKGVYDTLSQLQSVVSVGLFVLMGINTIRGNNFYVLRKLVNILLNLVSKNKKNTDVKT